MAETNKPSCNHKVIQAAPTTPSDDEVVSALRVVRLQRPKLGRAKVLSQLKDANKWILSDARLKKLMTLHGLACPTNQGEEEETPIVYPKDAMAAQERFKRSSTRCLRLYSREKYDYAVEPNCSVKIKFNASLTMIAHNIIVRMGRPTSSKEKQLVAQSGPMLTLWELYCAGAQKAGISKADIGRQLEAEYGVNPIPYLGPPPSEAEVKKRAAAFKKATMAFLKKAHKHEDGKALIPVDEKGRPVWIPEVYGEYAVVVFKIDKGKGLKEFGYAGESPLHARAGK